MIKGVAAGVLLALTTNAVADYVAPPSGRLNDRITIQTYDAPSDTEGRLRQDLARIESAIVQARSEMQAAQQQYDGGRIQYANAQQAYQLGGQNYGQAQQAYQAGAQQHQQAAYYCNMGNYQACSQAQSLQQQGIYYQQQMNHWQQVGVDAQQKMNAANQIGQAATVRYQNAVAQHNDLTARYLDVQRQLAQAAGSARFSDAAQAARVSDALLPMVKSQLNREAQTAVTSGGEAAAPSYSVDKLALQNLLLQVSGVRDCLGDETVDFLRSTRNFNSRDWQSAAAVNTVVGLLTSAVSRRSVCGGIQAD